MKSFHGQGFKKGVIGGEGGNSRSSIIKLSVVEDGGIILFVRCHYAKITSETCQLQREGEREMLDIAPGYLLCAYI